MGAAPTACQLFPVFRHPTAQSHLTAQSSPHPPSSSTPKPKVMPPPPTGCVPRPRCEQLLRPSIRMDQQKSTRAAVLPTRGEGRGAPGIVASALSPPLRGGGRAGPHLHRQRSTQPTPDECQQAGHVVKVQQLEHGDARQEHARGCQARGFWDGRLARRRALRCVWWVDRERRGPHEESRRGGEKPGQLTAVDGGGLPLHHALCVCLCTLHRAAHPVCAGTVQTCNPPSPRHHGCPGRKPSVLLPPLPIRRADLPVQRVCVCVGQG